MLKGKKLSNSSKFGIISPSSCENTKIIDKKISEFKLLGYNLKLGNHLYDKYSFFAGTHKSRAEDIINMFLDDTVEGIICLRGGYGCIHVLSHIPRKIIIEHPKFFCGYSDITLLLNYFSSLGLITFHGPMINSDFNDIQTLNSFSSIISYNQNAYTYYLNEYKNISYTNPSSFSGKIVGGNLSVICSSIGTPYEINTKNSILLIEEINEYPYAIHRMLTQLLYSGFLSKCNGIIVGYLSNESDYINSKVRLLLENAVIDALEPIKIPIILGFPFGHNYPNLTIPIGCTATFSLLKRTLTLNENYLI